MNVLIIDDDAPWAELASVMLKKVADRIRIAGTWDEAMNTIVKPNGFDVVLVDLNLPDSPADKTLVQIDLIRASGRKVVLMTGAPVSEFMREAGKFHGALDVLYKGQLDFPDRIQAVCA